MIPASALIARVTRYVTEDWRYRFPYRSDIGLLVTGRDGETRRITVSLRYHKQEMMDQLLVRGFVPSGRETTIDQWRSVVLPGAFRPKQRPSCELLNETSDALAGLVSHAKGLSIDPEHWRAFTEYTRGVRSKVRSIAGGGEEDPHSGSVMEIARGSLERLYPENNLGQDPSDRVSATLARLSEMGEGLGERTFHEDIVSIHSVLSYFEENKLLAGFSIRSGESKVGPGASAEDIVAFSEAVGLDSLGRFMDPTAVIRLQLEELASAGRVVASWMERTVWDKVAETINWALSLDWHVLWRNVVDVSHESPGTFYAIVILVGIILAGHFINLIYVRGSLVFNQLFIASRLLGRTLGLVLAIFFCNWLPELTRFMNVSSSLPAPALDLLVTVVNPKTWVIHLMALFSGGSPEEYLQGINFVPLVLVTSGGLLSLYLVLLAKHYRRKEGILSWKESLGRYRRAVMAECGSYASHDDSLERLLGYPAVFHTARRLSVPLVMLSGLILGLSARSVSNRRWERHAGRRYPTVTVTPRMRRWLGGQDWMWLHVRAHYSGGRGGGFGTGV